MKRKTKRTRYDVIGNYFFNMGYSVQTIAGHYGVDKELIEDKVRKYARKKRKVK